MDAAQPGREMYRRNRRALATSLPRALRSRGLRSRRGGRQSVSRVGSTQLAKSRSASTGRCQRAPPNRRLRASRDQNTYPAHHHPRQQCGPSPCSGQFPRGSTARWVVYEHQFMGRGAFQPSAFYGRFSTPRRGPYRQHLEHSGNHSAAPGNTGIRRRNSRCAASRKESLRHELTMLRAPNGFGCTPAAS